MTNPEVSTNKSSPEIADTLSSGKKKFTTPTPPSSNSLQLGFEYNLSKNSLRLARTDQARINKAEKERRKLEVAERRKVRAQHKKEAKKQKRAAKKARGPNAYIRELNRRRIIEENAIQVGRHEYETSNGGIQISEVTRHGVTISNVGEPGGKLVRHTWTGRKPVPHQDQAMRAVARVMDTEAEKWRQDHAPKSKSSPENFTNYEPNVNALPGTTEPGVNWEGVEKMITKLGDVIKK